MWAGEAQVAKQAAIDTEGRKLYQIETPSVNPGATSFLTPCWVKSAHFKAGKPGVSGLAASQRNLT